MMLMLESLFFQKLSIETRLNKTFLIIVRLFSPIDLFTILESQNQEIGELYVVQERHATDFEA